MSYGGNSGGTSRIATSADVALSNPGNGQALTYNTSLAKWQNTTLPAAGGGGTGSNLGSRFINVESYGVSSSGSASANSSALTAAIAALQDGATLYFPPGGSYTITDTVTVANLSNLTIIGEGATLIGNGTGDASRVLLISNCAHGSVRGLSLKHAATGPRRNDADGLTLQHCTDFNVTGVTVNYVYSIGIRIAGCQRINVFANTINGSVADGIGVYGSTRQPSNDVNMASGSAVMTSASAHFTDGDVGAIVQINAGPSNAEINVPIVSVQSATQVTLSTAASVNVANYYIRISRVSQNINIFGNNLPGTGDDAISSVGYRTYDSVPVGPNRNINVYGNTIINGGARGICFVGVWEGLINGNIVDSSKQGSVYVSTEPNVGGSWGCQDIEVADNILNDSNTDFGNGYSNYAAVSVDSVFSGYPVKNISVHNNTIRSPHSYYLRAGGDGGQQDSLGTQEIYFFDNICIGGNANNNAINVTKASNIYIRGNRIEKARLDAIYIDGSTGGTVLVQDNIITQYDRIQNGYKAIDTSIAGVVMKNNLINGVLTDTITGGSNA